MAELSLLMKVTVVLVLALVTARLGSRQSAAVRSLALACAFGLLLALPMTALMLPARAIEVPPGYALPFAREPIPAVAPAASASAAVDVTAAANSGVAMPSLRVSLLMLWAAGAIAFMAPLVVGLVRVRRMRTNGRPWTVSSVPSRIAIALHDDVRVPSTYGFRHPVIALPADAPQWPEADLRRVLLHEMEHVRRRDWPVHMAARAICALYWFHPLVWIAWQQLCLESERACDDAVLREEDGTAYAAQLVSLARRISRQDTLPLLSIAGRSNLSTRIGAMLARNVARDRVARATVVAIAGVAAVAALGVGPLQAVTSVQRPSAESARSRLAFESVSIRRTRSSESMPCCAIRYSANGRANGSNVDLVDLIVSAYDLYRWQVVNAPRWADARVDVAENRGFDVQAAAPRGSTGDEMRQMLRTMLAERFRLAVHRESRTQKVYELVVAPGGHKLLPPGATKYDPREDVWLRNDPMTWTATLSVDQMTTAHLARNLGFPMGTLVSDRTGLSGTYRISARWRSAPGTNEIFDAFPAQLGLQFRETTGRVEYLVVDRAERPALDAR